MQKRMYGKAEVIINNQGTALVCHYCQCLVTFHSNTHVRNSILLNLLRTRIVFLAQSRLLTAQSYAEVQLEEFQMHNTNTLLRCDLSKILYILVSRLYGTWIQIARLRVFHEISWNNLQIPNASNGSLLTWHLLLLVLVFFINSFKWYCSDYNRRSSAVIEKLRGELEQDRRLNSTRLFRDLKLRLIQFGRSERIYFK